MDKTSIIILLIFVSLTSIHAETDADTLVIKNHLQTISKTFENRNHSKLDILNKTADYISETSKKYTDPVSF